MYLKITVFNAETDKINVFESFYKITIAMNKLLVNLKNNYKDFQ